MDLGCYPCGVLRLGSESVVYLRAVPGVLGQIVGVGLACVLAGGCSPDGAPDSSAPQDAPHATVAPTFDDQSEEELEQLRALGYLDYSEEPKQAPGEGVVLWDQETAQPGYTLVVYAGACACDLIAMGGEVVQSWSDSPCRRWEQAQLLPDGDLLVVGTRSSKEQLVNEQMEGRYLLRLSWDGEIRWRRFLKVHHDIEITPQGSWLALMVEQRLVKEIDPEIEIWDDILTLLDDDGKVLDTLSIYDVVASSTLRLPIQIAGRTKKHGEQWIDLFHCNAAEWMRYDHLVKRHALYGPDNVLVTSRHQDAVMVINWRTRELVWFWGPGELSGPHAATVQPDGNILIFDNGLTRRWSRVIEVEPLSGTIVRKYTTPKKEDFFSRVMGSCQRLANGNVLIGNSTAGQGLELTADGQPAWVYMGTRRTENDFRVKIPRIRRIPGGEIEAILALVDKDSTARAQEKLGR